MSGAGLFGGFANVVGGIVGADIANTNNTAMQNRQLKWEREKFGMETDLANSAHQREIADLQKAGLNPILSAGGQGATTPQGGSIGALPDQSGQILSNSINSAVGQFLAGKEIDAKVNQMEHQNDLYDAEKLKALAESDLLNEKQLETIANTALLKSQRDLVDEQWNKAIHETQLAYYQVQQAYEELQYVKQNAKNKAEILAAERKMKTAEANMKVKEDKLWTFSYVWDRGMDAGKIAGTIFGLNKLMGNVGKLGFNSGKGLVGSKSIFGWDPTTGQYY